MEIMTKMFSLVVVLSMISPLVTASIFGTPTTGSFDDWIIDPICEYFFRQREGNNCQIFFGTQLWCENMVDVPILAFCKEAENITKVFFNNMQGKLFKVSSRYKKLVEINVRRSNFDQYNYNDLPAIKTLTTLRLEYITLNSGNTVNSQAQHLSFCEPMTNLKKLSLKGVGNDSLASIASIRDTFPELQFLTLSHNGLQSISNDFLSPKLQYVDVSYNELPGVERNIIDLASLMKLNYVFLDYNAITNMPASAFPKLVKAITARHNKIDRFDLHSFRKLVIGLDLRNNNYYCRNPAAKNTAVNPQLVRAAKTWLQCVIDNDVCSE